MKLRTGLVLTVGVIVAAEIHGVGAHAHCGGGGSWFGILVEGW